MVAIQVLKFWPDVKTLINGDDSFSEENRKKMGKLLEENEPEVLLELSLVKDIGESMVKFCHFQEGDGFLSPTTFNHFTAVYERIAAAADADGPLPMMEETVRKLYPALDDAGVMESILPYREKLKSLRKKFQHDMQGKLQQPLLVLRACRLLNYSWVAYISVEALRNEAHFFSKLPALETQDNPIPDEELTMYHSFALIQHDKDKDDPACGKHASSDMLIRFWLSNQIMLPRLFTAYMEAAVIMPSSGTSERVFSILSSCFRDNQTRCLQDIKETTVMLRYNESFRNKK